MRRGSVKGIVLLAATITGDLVGLGGCRPEDAPSPAATPPRAPPPLAVSLTFDDGWSDAWAARDLLAARGLRATFYIISGKLDTPDYLSRAQVDQLAADGHEIGGHTLTHHDLTTLDDAAARHEICDDRTALQALGYRVTTFAYPYGAANPAVENIAADCGYPLARGVGGLRAGATCRNCPAAETVPPANMRYVETPSSIIDHTSLSDIEAMLDGGDTERAEGRVWLPLVMHHVCDDCDEMAISPATLGALLDRLAAGIAAGRITVGTVAEVASLAEHHPG